MGINFDALQALAWSITYCLIIAYHIKERSLGIPSLAIASNFAWETVAFAQDMIRHHSPSLIHVSWVTLDIAIVLTFAAFCRPNHPKQKKLFFALYAIETVLFILLFRLKNGMLISSFVIDLMMAVAYFFFCFRKKMHKSVLAVSICVFKLLGDLFALIYYKQYSQIVLLIGVIVLLLNIGCLIFLLVDSRKPRNNTRKKR